MTLTWTSLERRTSFTVMVKNSSRFSPSAESSRRSLQESQTFHVMNRVRPWIIRKHTPKILLWSRKGSSGCSQPHEALLVAIFSCRMADALFLSCFTDHQPFSWTREPSKRSGADLSSAGNPSGTRENGTTCSGKFSNRRRFMTRSSVGYTPHQTDPSPFA